MLCVFIAPDVIHQQLMMMMMMGCGNILGIIFFILGINFFLWFQLEVETFHVAEEVGLEKKQLEGGWGGGRSASPQDAFAEHAA